jgi:hypothetical protein
LTGISAISVAGINQLQWKEVDRKYGIKVILLYLHEWDRVTLAQWQRDKPEIFY